MIILSSIGWMTVYVPPAASSHLRGETAEAAACADPDIWLADRSGDPSTDILIDDSTSATPEVWDDNEETLERPTSLTSQASCADAKT